MLAAISASINTIFEKLSLSNESIGVKLPPKKKHYITLWIIIRLEIVITRAAPAFHKLFMVMGCVFDINTVHKTVEKLTFQAFY